MTSVATLALAIGASTAMFSVLNAVLLRPLPFEAPDRLAMLWTEIPSRGLPAGRSAYGNVEAVAQAERELRRYRGVRSGLLDADARRRARADQRQPGLAEFLPAARRAARARPHLFAEEANDRQRLAVISHRFWQSRFGGSPAAIGASIELDGVRSEIIGIMPASCNRASTPTSGSHTRSFRIGRRAAPSSAPAMVRSGTAAAARDVRAGAGRDERDRRPPR